ncbi:MAG: hypothetical protein M1812_003627 [Candelaria pacifica]|nr:MAG: hypothetical protein M1812_003627 [Candelaria pacifica]
MEVPQSSRASRTITLDNGTVFALTEDQLSAFMAFVQAPKLPEGPSAGFPHTSTVGNNSAIALDKGRYATTGSLSFMPNQSPTAAMARLGSQPPLLESIDGWSTNGSTGYQPAAESYGFSPFSNCYDTAPELQTQPMLTSSSLTWPPTFDGELQGVLYSGTNAGVTQFLGEVSVSDLGELLPAIQDHNTQPPSLSPLPSRHVAAADARNKPASDHRMDESTSEYSHRPSNLGTISGTRKRKDPPASNEILSDAIPGLGCFASTSQLGKRGRYDATRREEVAAVRERGACIRCRWLGYKCSGTLPCGNCLKVKGPGKIWTQPCTKANFADVGLFSQIQTRLGHLQHLARIYGVAFHLRHMSSIMDLDARVNVKHFSDSLGAHESDFSVMISSTLVLHNWAEQPQKEIPQIGTELASGDRCLTTLQGMLRPKKLSQLSQEHLIALYNLIILVEECLLFDYLPAIIYTDFFVHRLSEQELEKYSAGSHDWVQEKPRLRAMKEALLHLLGALGYYRSMICNRVSVIVARPHEDAQLVAFLRQVNK